MSTRFSGTGYAKNAESWDAGGEEAFSTQRAQGIMEMLDYGNVELWNWALAVGRRLSCPTGRSGPRAARPEVGPYFANSSFVIRNSEKAGAGYGKTSSSKMRMV